MPFGELGYSTIKSGLVPSAAGDALRDRVRGLREGGGGWLSIPPRRRVWAVKTVGYICGFSIKYQVITLSSMATLTWGFLVLLRGEALLVDDLEGHDTKHLYFRGNTSE